MIKRAASINLIAFYEHTPMHIKNDVADNLMKLFKKYILLDYHRVWHRREKDTN